MKKNFNFDDVKKLMLNNYKAEVIDKTKFKELLYGFNRRDIGDDIGELTEGIIKSENAVYYLINDIDVINKNCKCIDPNMYSTGKVLPLPLSMFYPYILFVVELSEDGKDVLNYAKWGSFSDNFLENISKLSNCPQKQ